jgi:hypothetical protein
MEKIIRTKEQFERLSFTEQEIKKQQNYYQNHISKYTKD